MIVKCPSLITVFVVILLLYVTKQHYIPPPDYCALAKICNHTGISLCGIEIRNKNSRLFLDECDLFEYNCDYQTDYTEAKSEICSSNGMLLSSTLTTSTKVTTPRNISSSGTSNAMANYTSQTVNVAVTPSIIKPTSETRITTISTTNKSLTNSTCTCPSVTCPSLNITDITHITNSSTVSPFNTTALSISSLPMTNVSTEATTYMTNTEAETDSLSEAVNNSSVTETITNSNITESRTANSSNTALNFTKTASLTTCTFANPVTSTAEIKATSSATETQDIGQTTPATKPATTATIDKSTMTEKEIIKSQIPCEYPKHCDRPSTWETTAIGETRDFYQILRAQFGDRVKLLRDTTHFPRRIAKDFAHDEGFQFGHHNEKTNEI